MGNFKPNNRILRCYGYRLKDGPYYGVCVDLNLAIQTDSLEKLKREMNKVITSYLDAVLNTDNPKSIPHLLQRRAPIQDWVIYYFIKMILFVKRFPENLILFKESVPIHLPHTC